MTYKDNYVNVVETGGRFIVTAQQGDEGDPAPVAVREYRAVAETIASRMRRLLSENTDNAHQMRLHEAQELQDLEPPELPTTVDAAIEPMVRELNHAGYVTLQSCSGHAGSESHPTAHLWLRSPFLSDELCERLSEIVGMEQVSRVWGREEGAIVELIFAGETMPDYRDCWDSILDLLRSAAS